MLSSKVRLCLTTPLRYILLPGFQPQAAVLEVVVIVVVVVVVSLAILRLLLLLLLLLLLRPLSRLAKRGGILPSLYTPSHKGAKQEDMITTRVATKLLPLHR